MSVLGGFLIGLAVAAVIAVVGLILWVKGIKTPRS